MQVAEPRTSGEIRSVDICPVAALVIVSGDEQIGRDFYLGPQETILGRSSSADIRLLNLTVSRKHCRIWCEAGVYNIEDLGSTNTTRINGRRINSAELRDGDQLALGRVLMRFKQSI